MRTNRKLEQATRESADETITMTMDEARELPGLLGRFVVAGFTHGGFYGCTVDGKRRLYILDKKEN